MNDYKIEFDDEKHEYKVNGEVKPSVSQVWSDVIKENEPIPEYARPAIIRGTYTHKAIELDIKGRLDRSSLTDKDIAGNFASYEKFRKAHKIEIVDNVVEYRCYDPILDICGTIDVPDMLIDGCPYVIDWKTGGIYPDYKYKITGYKLMLQRYRKDKDFSGHLVAAVQLFKDGSEGKLIVFEDDKYVEAWNSICRAYWIKHGRL